MAIAFVIFLVCLTLVIPTRLWQYLVVIEPDTGFYSGPHISIWILYGTLILGAVLLLIFIARDKHTLDYPYQNGTQGLGLFFMLTTLVMGISTGLSIWKLLGQQMEVLQILRNHIFSVLFIIFFFIISFRFILGKVQGNTMRLLMIVPVIWAISMLWQTFTGYQTILTISEHLFEIISYILITLFFLSLANVVSGFGGSSHQKKLVFFGLTGALVCIGNVVGKFYASLHPQFETFTASNELAYLLDLMVCILMVVSAAYLCFGKDREHPEEDILESNPIPPAPAGISSDPARDSDTIQLPTFEKTAPLDTSGEPPQE